VSDRYTIKRAAGIPDRRRDGSRCDPETDRQAEAAEAFAAIRLGCEFRADVTVHGDGGSDFVAPNGQTVEVVWLGFVSGTATPRTSGNLIVNPDEPQRWAELYVVVAGSIARGFRLLGWTTHEELTRRPRVDFGFGPKFAVPTRELWRFASREPVRAVRA
jgi:hypothetical protein